MKILIVEDDSDTVSLLVTWLSSEGHDVLGITGGLGTTDWVRNHERDVVLLDVKLPDTNGLSLIPEIVQQTDAKVIVMSGLAPETWRLEAMSRGALDCLSKPIDFDSLKQILGNIASDPNLSIH